MGAGKLKKYGLNSLNEGDTYSAIDYFEAYLAQKENAKIMFLLAESYRAARDYPNALKWYNKAYDADPKKNVLALYYEGTMLKTEKRYEEAYQKFKKFKKAYEAPKDDNTYSKLVKTQMLSCDTAHYYLDSTIVVWISHLDSSINKASVEFSPFFLTDSTFIYSSLKSDTAVFTVKSDDEFETPVRQIYYGERQTRNWKSNGLWKEGDFNIPEINTGNGTFSPDKKRFYFTRCDKNWKNKVICQIYRSEKKEGRWQEPELLPELINHPKFTTTQPAIGKDSKRGEEVLYFVSDREGGKGGLDIWYTIYRKKKKEWKDPRNCGSKINTPGDEITPYVDQENRTLYFSSNGLPTLGEHDIFRVVGELSKWMPYENIGYPINSPFDDFYYSLNSTMEEGFFVSNRPGGVNVKHETCCDDIYAFKYNEVIHVAAEGKVYAIVDEEIQDLFNENFIKSKKEGEVDTSEETEDYDYIEGAVVSLYLIDQKNKDLVYIKNDTTDANGNYHFKLEPGKEYALEFENYGQFNKKIKVSTKDIRQSEVISIQDIGVNLIPKTSMIIKNIYYEYDKYELTKEAKEKIEKTLLKILNETPQIVIEISAHTDSKGDDEYNRNLSQQRAESVVKHLVRKGIDPKRLYAKGYGETKPIAPNENPDGSDNPAGREKNRRTEFKIIGSLDQYTEIIYEE